MKWRRLRPGRKALARRFLAAHRSVLRRATEALVTPALRTGQIGSIIGTSFYTTPIMAVMDRRQWRRYERKRKRAGL